MLPMLFVTATTLTAGTIMAARQWLATIVDPQRTGPALKEWVSLPTTIFVVACVLTLLLLSISRWIAVYIGSRPIRTKLAGKE